MKNSILKFLSFFLAVNLWFYVANLEPLEVDKEFDLTIKPPLELAVANKIPQKIAVKLRGPRNFLRGEYRQNILVKIKKFQVGAQKQMELVLGKEDIPVPLGVEILEIRPKKIKLKLDRKITKVVKIIPVFLGEIPPDLKFIKKKVFPSSIVISGPVNVMRKTPYIETGPIELSQLSGKGEVLVDLSNLDPRIEYADTKPYKFDYELRSNKSNRELKDLKIRFLSSKRNFKAEKKLASVSVLVPESLEETFKESDIQILADIPEGRKGQTKVKLKANLPEGIHLLEIKPEYINVQLPSKR